MRSNHTLWLVLQSYRTNLHSWKRNRHLWYIYLLKASWVISSLLIWSRYWIWRTAAVHIYGRHLTKFAKEMSRWLRKYFPAKEMSMIGKNILSDPTSDGNISRSEEVGPRYRPSSPPLYSYEEFDRRFVTVQSQDDSSSLTQTCPTCGGSGKLTRGTLISFSLLMNHVWWRERQLQGSQD